MPDKSDDKYNFDEFLEEQLEKEFKEIQERIKELDADYTEMKRLRKEYKEYTEDSDSNEV